MQERIFFKVEDLAARWGCSEGKVRRMIRDGQLAALRLCNAYRIPEESVQEYETINMTELRPISPETQRATRDRQRTERSIVRAII